jgi:hypothetical protein
MEAITLDTAFAQVGGQGQGFRHRRHARVERRVEAGDLREAAVRAGNSFDACERCRKMKGRERYGSLQRREERVVNTRGIDVVRPAVHDAMPRSVEVRCDVPEVAQRSRDGGSMIGRPVGTDSGDLGAPELGLDVTPDAEDSALH